MPEAGVGKSDRASLFRRCPPPQLVVETDERWEVEGRIVGEGGEEAWETSQRRNIVGGQLRTWPKKARGRTEHEGPAHPPLIYQTSLTHTNSKIQL